MHMNRRVPKDDGIKSERSVDNKQKSEHPKLKRRCKLCRRLFCFCCESIRDVDEDDLSTLLRKVPGQSSLSSLEVVDKFVIFSGFKKQKTVETGVIGKKVPSRKKFKTMTQLRNESIVTAQLPSPQEAIMLNNERSTLDRFFTNEKKKSEDRSIEVVNTQLRIRLSSGFTLMKGERVDEWGEALLAHANRFHEPRLRMSRLVDYMPTENHTPNSGRISSSNTMANRIYNKRMSSSINMISLQHMLMLSPQLLENPYMNLDHLNLKDFIDTLLNMSKRAKQELETNQSHSIVFIKSLDKYLKQQENTKPKERSKGLVDRWMVLVYTLDEIDGADEMTVFRCLLTRLLLQNYHVAYAEKDMSQSKVREELALRLDMTDMSNVNLPQLFHHGTCIGGCQVIYTIYIMKLMRTIFKDFIMDSKKYFSWLNARDVSVTTLSVDVKLKHFHSLMVLAKSSNDYMLTPSDLKKVRLGKEVVKIAREKWYDTISVPFQSPPMFYFAILKSTIVNAFDIMNKIYMKYIMFASKDVRRQAKDKTRRISWLPKLGDSVPDDYGTEI